MKTFNLLFFGFIFLFVQIKSASASHAIGADLTYRCTGPGTTPGSFIYEISYTLYRDCSGIAAPVAPGLVVSNSCGYIVPTFNLIPTINSPIQISPACPSAVTTCNGGSIIGIEEWIYTGSVTLPGPCHDWTFSHTESARYSGITTLSSIPGDLYVYSVLNNNGLICNNSPTFSNRPVPILCVGQQFCFNHSAFDSEGDSLTFQIITPRTGPLPSDTIDYAPGYSASQPLISNPLMTFNPLTGEFCTNPTLPDISVLAILVNEYRNGILIGQIERDLQITVFVCSNILPKLTGLNGTSDYTESICLNEQNCFYISSIDQDNANITYISWDHSIPNASLTTSGGNRDTAFFCWTPTSSDTLSNPYRFTVTVKDDNCPYLGIQNFTYLLEIDTSSACIPLKVNSIDKNYSSLKIYPQPATDLLNIDIGFIPDKLEKYSINITNVLGKSVGQSNINEQVTFLNTGDWATGVYFVNLISNNKGLISREKIMIIE